MRDDRRSELGRHCVYLVMIAPPMIDLAVQAIVFATLQKWAWQSGWDARTPELPRALPMPTDAADGALDAADIHLGSELQAHMNSMVQQARYAGGGFLIVRHIAATCDGVRVGCRLVLDTDQLACAQEVERRRGE